MALMNLTKHLKLLKTDLSRFKEDFMQPIGKRQYGGNHRTNIEELSMQIGTYELMIAKVLDAIVELYKREDKQVVGVPSTKDYVKHRKALDSLVFSKEDNIIHLQIREDMDKSSYKITILENDQLKAVRL